MIRDLKVIGSNNEVVVAESIGESAMGLCGVNAVGASCRVTSRDLLYRFDRRFGRCATRHRDAPQQVQSKYDRSTIDGDVGNL
jgi:hypothetical protein